MRKTPYLRIFLSSPGDVSAERKIAMEVIEALPYRPAFRDKVAFRIVAWDRPEAGTPMLASISPQEAINQGLPKPSECDICVAIFWTRLGTPFIDVNGDQYESGTHWELLDALNSPTTATVIYRRTEEVRYKYDDKAGIDQYMRLNRFFESDLFYENGRIRRGVNQYGTPEDFRRQFETHLEAIVARILAQLEANPETEPVVPPGRPETPPILTRPVEKPSERNKVFISYSHRDKKWLKELQTYLKPLERDHHLELWDDTRINPGEKWQDKIKQALASAKIAVLLVSADFLASDFIDKNELPPLLKAAEDDGVIILWIAVSSCLFEYTPIAEYQATNDPAKPLDTLRAADRSRVLTEIARKIMAANAKRDS